MKLETLGHACLALYEQDSGAAKQQPIITTDPWLIGSCYWRSWWLQSYPEPETISWLSQSKYVYITHEHPDHFHPPSIRTLENGPIFLMPEFAHRNIHNYLVEAGAKIQVMPEGGWIDLAQDVRAMSIPLFNDDSLLIIETKDAVILNLNDAPVLPNIMKKVVRLVESLGSKRRIVLKSSAPASLINAFIRPEGSRIRIMDKAGFCHRASKSCKQLKADHFMPFASQVLFMRDDSRWANEYSLRYSDLREHWDTDETELLHPYSIMDLESGAHSFLPEDEYNEGLADKERLIELERALDEHPISKGALGRLEKSLNWIPARLLTLLLLARGISFALNNGEVYRYSPWTGKIRADQRKGTVRIRTAANAFGQASEYGHFADLGISMFTHVDVRYPWLHSRAVYLLFTIVEVAEHGHFETFGAFGSWLTHNARRVFRQRFNV